MVGERVGVTESVVRLDTPEVNHKILVIVIPLLLLRLVGVKTGVLVDVIAVGAVNTGVPRLH